MTELLKFKGSPGSPYTRKMLAILRYRRIPYSYGRYRHGEVDDLPKPKVTIVPIFYFKNDAGELEAMVDSTPIIRRLESEYSGRSVVPRSPVLNFLNYLLEDYGDEWLTKAMFHYRWYRDVDIEHAGSFLAHESTGISAPDSQVERAKNMFIERQTERLYVVGSNEITASVIENSYKRFLAVLNNHLREMPFLLGNRPCSADFACLGQLTQLTQIDPTPTRLTGKEFPRVYNWVFNSEDLSGLEVDDQTTDSGLIDPENIPVTLVEILKEMGRTYVPVMLANAHALANGLELVQTEVDGKPWEQQPFPYQAKCVQWLRAEYAKLDEPDKALVDRILAGTGCEPLLA